MTDLVHGEGTHDDRLPWLEAVEDEEGEERVSVAKLVALIVAALVALGLVIGGVWWLRSQNGVPVTDPKLIAAQEGDYKVKPETPGGMKVEGKGDSAFATSEGAEAKGRIDNATTPETPLKTAKGVKPAVAVAQPKPSATVAMAKPGGKLTAKPATPVAAPPSGDGMVQLGAFGSRAKAESAWSAMVKRFAELGPLSKTVAEAQVGGSTVYRLRANAGGQAATLCTKLKAAGENCMRVN